MLKLIQRVFNWIFSFFLRMRITVADGFTNPLVYGELMFGPFKKWTPAQDRAASLFLRDMWVLQRTQRLSRRNILRRARWKTKLFRREKENYGNKLNHRRHRKR